jgi:hypothetical protein
MGGAKYRKERRSPAGVTVFGLFSGKEAKNG